MSAPVTRTNRPPVPRAIASSVSGCRRETTGWPFSSRLNPTRRPSRSISGTGCPVSVPTPTVCMTTAASRALRTAVSTSPSRSSPSETSTMTLFRRVLSAKTSRPLASPTPSEVPGEGTLPGSRIRGTSHGVRIQRQRDKRVGLEATSPKRSPRVVRRGSGAAPGNAGDGVLRDHGARGVDDGDNTLTFLPHDAPLRPRRRECYGARPRQQQSSRAQRQPRPAPQDARPQRPGHGRAVRSRVASRAPRLTGGPKRQRQWSPEPRWSAKVMDRPDTRGRRRARPAAAGRRRRPPGPPGTAPVAPAAVDLISDFSSRSSGRRWFAASRCPMRGRTRRRSAARCS